MLAVLAILKVLAPAGENIAGTPSNPDPTRSSTAHAPPDSIGVSDSSCNINPEKATLQEQCHLMAGPSPFGASSVGFSARGMGGGATGSSLLHAQTAPVDAHSTEYWARIGRSKDVRWEFG